VEEDYKARVVLLPSMVHQDGTDELSTSRLEPFQIKAVFLNAVIGIQSLFHILFSITENTGPITLIEPKIR